MLNDCGVCWSVIHYDGSLSGIQHVAHHYHFHRNIWFLFSGNTCSATGRERQVLCNVLSEVIGLLGKLCLFSLSSLVYYIVYPNPCSRFLWTDWPFILSWIRTSHFMHSGFMPVKSLMLGFVLELSDLTFGLQLFVREPLFTSCPSPGAV